MTLEELNAAAAELRQSLGKTPYSETDKDEDLARLEAILTLASCAISSGQVAEDVEHLQRVLADPLVQRQTGPEFRAALSRLSALARRATALEKALALEIRQTKGVADALTDSARECNALRNHLDTERKRADRAERALCRAARAAEAARTNVQVRLRDMAEEDTDAPVPADFRAGWRAALMVLREALGDAAPNHPELPESSHYPCSPTCTHDDAATPGHAKRVEERSEALQTAVAATVCPLCDGTGTCNDVDRWPNPTRVSQEKCIACDGTGTVNEEMGEGVTDATSGPINPDADGEADQPLPEGPLDVVYPNGVVDPAFVSGFERGADAMRAACIGAALRWAEENYGLRPRGLKAALEGAAP
jgi:hypothetical protein